MKPLAHPQPYASLSGIADGSNLFRDLDDKLLDIGSSAAIASQCIADRDWENLPRAINDMIDSVAEVPRLHSRVANWLRVFGRRR